MSNSDSDVEEGVERGSRNHRSRSELELEREVERLRRSNEKLTWHLDRSHKGERVASREHQLLCRQFEACEKELKELQKQLAEKETTLASVFRDNEQLEEKFTALLDRHREVEAEKWVILKMHSDQIEHLRSLMDWQTLRLEKVPGTAPAVPLVGVNRRDESVQVSVGTGEQMESSVAISNESEQIEEVCVGYPHPVPQGVTGSRQSRSDVEEHADALPSQMEPLVTMTIGNENVQITEASVKQLTPRRVTRSRVARKTLFEPKADAIPSQMESPVAIETESAAVVEGLVEEPIPKRVTRSLGSSQKRPIQALASMPSSGSQVADQRKRRSLIQTRLDQHAEDTSVKGIFRCICGRQYANKYNLIYHTQKFGDSNMLFECSMCGKRFVAGFKLKRHLKQVHKLVDSASKSATSCSKCGLWFENRLMYTRHKQMDCALHTD